MPEPNPLVCRFGAFGDMVMITPLLKHLYRRSGLACDIVAIGAWNRLLFEQMPYVRQVFTIESRARPYWINPGQRELVATLKAQRHLFAWICETDSRSYRLLARAGIKRSSSATQLDLAAVKAEHYCEKWLRLANLSPAGFEYPQLAPPNLDTELFVSDEEVEACRQWLRRRGLDPDAPIVCIQAGSKRTTRRSKADRKSNTKFWHQSNWAQVIEGLLEHKPETQVLLCGVPAEADMCDTILAHCKASDRVQSAAQDLPLRRLLALLSLAHSCISVDTGPAHAAAALNCPLVVLFGKANPGRFRPISSQSPVAVITGEAENSEPDISRITPRQVLDSWISNLSL